MLRAFLLRLGLGEEVLTIVHSLITMVYCPSVVFLSIFVGKQGFDAGDKVNLYGDPQSPGLGKPCHHDAFGDSNQFAKIKDKLSFQLRLTIYLHLVHQSQFYFQTDYQIHVVHIIHSID